MCIALLVCLKPNFFSVKFQNFVVTCEYSNTDSLDLPLIMRPSVVRILFTVVKFNPCTKMARVLCISLSTGLGCVWLSTWSNLAKIWSLSIGVVCEDNVWSEAMICLSQADAVYFGVPVRLIHWLDIPCLGPPNLIWLIE